MERVKIGGFVDRNEGGYVLFFFVFAFGLYYHQPWWMSL